MLHSRALYCCLLPREHLIIEVDFDVVFGAKTVETLEAEFATKDGAEIAICKLDLLFFDDLAHLALCIPIVS